MLATMEQVQNRCPKKLQSTHRVSCFRHYPKDPTCVISGACCLNRFSIYPHTLYLSTYTRNLILSKSFQYHLSMSIKFHHPEANLDFQESRCITLYLMLAACHSKADDKRMHLKWSGSVWLIKSLAVYCKGGVPGCPNGPNDCSRILASTSNSPFLYQYWKFRTIRWKHKQIEWLWSL